MDRASSTYGERTGTNRVLVGKPKGREYFEDLSAYGSII
jgi:hypothetical protein